MAFVVNTQPLVRRYRAGLCSGACCLCVVTVVATVLLPLFFGLASEGFWTKEVIRFEQPDVTFSNDLVVYATGERLTEAGVAVPLSLGFSTVPRVNALLGSRVRAVSIQSRLTTATGDARLDTAAWNISVPLLPSETVTAVSLILPCTLRLHDTVRLDTASALVVTAGSGSAGRAAAVVGDARLRFRMQLPAGTRYLDPAASTSVIDLAGALSLDDVSPTETLLALQRRNVTLELEQPAVVWAPEPRGAARATGAAAGTAAGGFESVVPAGQGRAFSLRVSVRIPPQPVWMRPTLSETLKLAWVQYLALLVPIFIAFWALSCLVLDSGIIDAGADADRVVKAKLH